MYEQLAALKIDGPGIRGWFRELILWVSTFAALWLSISMLLTDDLGASMLADAEGGPAKTLSAIPAPWPAVGFGLLGLYGVWKTVAGLRLITGKTALVYQAPDVHGLVLSAKALAGPEVSLNAARGSTIVISSQRVTLAQSKPVRTNRISLQTDEGILSVDTKADPRRITVAPLETAARQYSIAVVNNLPR